MADGTWSDWLYINSKNERLWGDDAIGSDAAGSVDPPTLDGGGAVIIAWSSYEKRHIVSGGNAGAN